MRITVAQAAAMMNVSPQFVRIGLQRGVLPIGSAVKMSSRWTYHISEHLLNEYLGISLLQQTINNKERTIKNGYQGK